MSTSAQIVQVDTAVAAAKFLKAPFTLRHGLADHPLFALPRLIQLAKSLPRDRIEYNSGKVAVGVKPSDVPKIDMAAEEVIRSIETANAWMVIKMVEQDPEYRAMLEAFVEQANLAADRKAGDYSDLQGEDAPDLDTSEMSEEELEDLLKQLDELAGMKDLEKMLRDGGGELRGGRKLRLGGSGGT